jgi:transposase
MSEELLLDVYSVIREIEYSFRTLKTDLDLRPVYHKKHESTMAHLHLGLLAYWVVNTVRYRLKQHATNFQWREIVRIMNTQKAVTSVSPVKINRINVSCNKGLLNVIGIDNQTKVNINNNTGLCIYQAVCNADFPSI